MKELASIPSTEQFENTIGEFKGYLFDMDGTLFDSEDFHMIGIQEVLMETEFLKSTIPGTKDLKEWFLGMPDTDVFYD